MKIFYEYLAVEADGAATLHSTLFRGKYFVSK